MNKEIEEKIREIATYHSDDGTSGYCLTEEQIEKIADLFEAKDKELIKYNGILLEEIEAGIKRAKEDQKKELIEKIRGMNIWSKGTAEGTRKDIIAKLKP